MTLIGICLTPFAPGSEDNMAILGVAVALLVVIDRRDRMVALGAPAGHGSR